MTNQLNEGATRTLQAPVRKDYITLASVVAALSVMFLHTNGCFWWMNPVNDTRWAFTNMIESLFYFAAPLYFMISGATLMDYNDRCTLGQYFVRRIKKIIPAFVVWNVVALFYDVYYKKSMMFAPNANVFTVLFKKGIITDINNPLSSVNFFEGILTNKFLGIYWFLPAIMAVYLILPLFAAVEKEKRRKIFTYFAIVWLILSKLLPFFFNLIHVNHPSAFQWPIQEQGMFFDYVLYAVLGYLVSEYEAPAWMRYTVYGLALAAFLMHWIGTYFRVRKTGDFYLFKGYEKFPSYLYATGIFLLIKRISGDVMRWKPLRFVIEKMAKYTFATYLMHWYLMEFFIDMFHAKWFTNLFHCAAIDNLTFAASLWYRLLTPFLLYAVCMGIAWVLRKIPLVKHIVP